MNDVNNAMHDAMIGHILRGSKPREEWRTGVELELIGYKVNGGNGASLERLDYASVRKVLEEYEGEPIIEGGSLVGVRGQHGSLTLEPGGQLEYSSLPQRKLIDSECDIVNYLAWLRRVSRAFGFRFIGVGFDPIASLESQHWVPKPRYSIMRPYLKERGARAWDMMTRTAAIQVNVDFDSETDLAEKFVLGNRVAPVAAAIFANSPFKEGRLSGFKSERTSVWLEMDPDRSGIAAPALGGEFSLDSFLDAVVKTPMFYVRRDDEYVNVAGVPFEDLLVKGQATIDDFVDHLTTIFTEARLKQFIELRSTDSGNARTSLAIEAFWKGLLYDDEARREALRLAPDLDANGFRQLQYEVARDALEARHDGVDVGMLARELLELSRAGLARIAPDETHYLDEISNLVISEGLSPADILTRNFQGSWNGRIDKVVDYLAI